MDTRTLCNVIAATVHDMGTTGAPSGVLYSGLMGRAGLSDYQNAVGICVRAGLVTLEGNVLRGTDKLAAIMAKLTVAA